VTTNALLDRILVPRPNGSAALDAVAAFLAERLAACGADATLEPFTATPHGFALAWTAALALLAGWAACLATRRYGAALALAVALPLLLLAEFEALRSPVSGLAAATEHNVVGTFAGAPGGPTLVFGAHYDTTTHFGDHLSWGVWGLRQGPAAALALLLPLAGLWRRRRGGGLPRAVVVAGALLAAAPFAAMFWFQALGPLLRASSPGAVDNGGSVAALLRLAERLGARPAGAPMTVRLVFFAAEEERALGSWSFARALPGGSEVVVVNLEAIGASDELAWVPEDGFALRRWRSPAALVALVDDAAREVRGAPLAPRALPFGTLTDGRSFLAHGIPALTLRAFTGEGFPRRLHSAHDARERLSVPAIERSVALLEAIVRRADAQPARVREIARAGGGPW
jgi:acetylornithine deacetylase/succinyl-diaminopimelate desuccinylase-like protein